MKYDIAIIGGGPAGLMAAVRSAELGAKVILLEKNPRLGIKLLLTGGGRCNLTNKILDPRAFVARLGSQARFLLVALHKFGVKETLEFFQSRGLKTKVENNNRVFPASNKASDVLDVLLKELQKYQVEIRTQSPVKKIVSQDNKIVKIVLTSGQEILANNFILATGGKSYPQTGSVGDGYKWLKQMNHSIIFPQPSLTPLLVEADFIKALEGLSISEAKLNLYFGAKKIASSSGDVIFTSSGLSGPAALDLSRSIDPEAIKDLHLEVDFLPQLETSALDKKLQQVLASGAKQIKNSIEGLVIPKFKPILFKLSQINPEKKSSLISRQERLALVKLLKNFKLKIKALAGFDRAMITSGGAVLTEIDPRTMRSKIISNLFIVGEILDLAGPTGGYNLQICWSSGALAGESAAVGLKSGL
ncbi:MAG: NAD(P)/FAD-dependent oxidoreductase [Candidatus Parcubacteria bacterium]|nr:NAD(P)/FAD-dependent oxidoreductase [Candidatus Parcubacteria bacterium]